MACLLAVVVSTTYFLPASAIAVDRYWDVSGAAPGAGGSTPEGVWSGVDPNWTNDANGAIGPTSGWISNDTAIFSAGTDATGTFAITVLGTQTTNAIVFQEGNVIVEGPGQLTLIVPRVVQVEAAASATINASIGGSSGLIKEGPGTLTLFGSHTYTGATIINAGKIIGSIPGGLSLSSGGFLGGNSTVNGTLSNSGTVSPGNSIGVVTVNGQYSQPTGGVLEIEIQGTGSGQFDKLVIAGAGNTATLGGTLQVVNQNPGGPLMTNVPVLTGQVTPGTFFSSVVTMGSSSTYFAPNYHANGTFSLSQFFLGDMDRDTNGPIGDGGDVTAFALALTRPEDYFTMFKIEGSQSGNMDGMPGLDFDDVDNFAAAAGVSAARVFQEIERLSAPEPNSFVLTGMGMIWAAAAPFSRRRRS